MIRNTPAKPRAGVILGSQGSLSSSFTSLALSVPLSAAPWVAVGTLADVVEDRDADDEMEVVEFCAVEAAEDRKDSAASVEAAGSEVTVMLSDDGSSVEALGESVVKLGRLDAPLTGSESCRIRRAGLSKPDTSKGSVHPSKVSMTTQEGRILGWLNSRLVGASNGFAPWALLPVTQPVFSVH